MSVSYGGDSIVFADGSVQSGGWTGFKNRIINGGMVIDHDDTSAFMQDKSFALLLHGVQPKGSDASKALSVLKKQGIHGYGKKKDVRELAVG